MKITFIFAAMFAYAIEMQKVLIKNLDRQSEQEKNKVDHN